MSTITDIYKKILDLPKDQRAALACDILDSLSANLSDADEGLAEARRRSKELDDDPTLAVSWQDIKTSLGR